MRKLFRLKNYMSLKNKNEKKRENKTEQIDENIPKSISEVKKKLREMFTDSSDFVLREIVVGKDRKKNILIAYIDGLVDKTSLTQNIIRPLILEKEKIEIYESSNDKDLFSAIKYNILYSCEVEDSKDFKALIQDMLGGDTLLFVENQTVALKLCTKGWEQRGVEMPETEAVVRGPREGFTESLRVNTSMIRRKIKNPKLKFEQLSIGSQTNTDVAICYIKGIANETIINTVKERLNEIKIDAILESGYIEEFIEDHPYSIFPTVGNTERPDIVAAKILEGRIAILCDGTPFVLTVPHLFVETLQANEDYYSRPYFASIIRIMRFFALFITLTLPAMYVAWLSFHIEAIPFQLLFSMAASREGIPFSSFTEALLMLIAFQFLREAGVRMPRAVGQAISIVGALVLGEAAVRAGIASNFLIIVISITAITSFIVAANTDSVVIIRLALLIGANILGIMGVALILFGFIAHMCSLRSFGVPYMAPFAPLNTMDLKDSFVRFPIWSLLTRPNVLSWWNKDRTRYKVDHK